MWEEFQDLRSPASTIVSFQVFVNFAKKQSDNLEQQEAPPPGAGPSPLQRLLNVLKSRQTPTELSALMSQDPELESDDDEGLISFEEERVRSREEGGEEKGGRRGGWGGGAGSREEGGEEEGGWGGGGGGRR